MTENITKLTIEEIIPIRGCKQGDESFKVRFSNGEEKILQTWDYTSIYSYPHLYTKLFCELLGYKAFEELTDLLLMHAQHSHQTLRILDVACGSGLMGNCLREKSAVKIDTLIGVDIAPEAINAINRDLQGVYDDIFCITEATSYSDLKKYQFNCISMSGAASHMTLKDLKNYVDLLHEEEQGYLVFNLLKDKVDHRRDEILGWIEEHLSFCESKIYEHRRLMNGEIVYHEAFLYKRLSTK